MRSSNDRTEVARRDVLARVTKFAGNREPRGAVKFAVDVSASPHWRWRSHSILVAVVAELMPQAMGRNLQLRSGDTELLEHRVEPLTVLFECPSRTRQRLRTRRD